MKGPLAVRDFQLLSAGQAASTIGDYCYAIALPWYVLSSHGSTILLGVVLACYAAPRTVLIPVGGMLADRISPRTVMLIADSVRCVLVGVLVLLAVRHSVSLAYLGPTAALIGGAEGLFIPASYAILPSLLDSTLLVAANGTFAAIQQAGSMIGPAVGGAVVALASPAPAFGVDAASFAVSAMTLAFITRRASQPEARPGLTGEEADAPGQTGEDAGAPGSTGEDAGAPGSTGDAARGGVLRLLRTSPVLQICLITTIVANLASAGLSQIALPDLAHERFAASGFGVLLVCFAGGSIVGSLVAARSDGLRRPAVIAGLAFVAESLAIGFAPFFGDLPGVAGAVVMVGFFDGLGNMIIMPRLQAWAPPEMIGRVMSLVMLCAFGSDPISTLATGVFVHRFGAVAFFPVAGCLIGMTVLAAQGSRQWRSFGALPETSRSPGPAQVADLPPP